jgi:hypothetical protein
MTLVGALEEARQEIESAKVLGDNRKLLELIEEQSVSDLIVAILGGMNIRPPGLPIISNVTGEFYPMGPEVEPEMIQLLGKQVASPVQFVKGLNTLYRAGADYVALLPMIGGQIIGRILLPKPFRSCSIFPNDEKAYSLSDQYMYGPSFLVAPVTLPEARTKSVYLPAGTWTDFWTEETITGPKQIIVSAPLAQIPLFG